MCDPITLAIAAGGMQVGQGVMGYQSAKAGAKAQDDMYNMNRKNAIEAANDSYKAIGARQQQEMQASSEDMQARKLQMIREASTANVAAGESGISGFAIERVFGDIARTAMGDVSNIQQNTEWNIQQLSSEAQGISANTKSRIASVSPGTKPNPWAHAFSTLANAGQAGASTYFGAGGELPKGKSTTTAKGK